MEKHQIKHEDEEKEPIKPAPSCQDTTEGHVAKYHEDEEKKPIKPVPSYQYTKEEHEVKYYEDKEEEPMLLAKLLIGVETEAPLAVTTAMDEYGRCTLLNDMQALTELAALFNQNGLPAYSTIIDIARDHSKWGITMDESIYSGQEHCYVKFILVT
ncbi:hypothetical protein EKO27_g7862 [Xylaria grammica]|uniref:Uncharacterized protein n=1 Tax=Xylaria grammica TaxID=363999 RepID=A0A439CZ25_9PEZI|nr:hypothetical protein EKO27_g7862 [Xylaria grammica]